MALVGYARVSTLEQETYLQLDALASAGVLRVYQEKRSARSHRPVLERMLCELMPGDVLCVYKVDRLARSLADLMSILDRVSRAGATFRSLTEPIETATPVGRMILQIIGAFAEFERNVIRERTVAGLEAARARGVRFGRERAMSRDQEAECVSRFRSGGYTKTQLATLYGCHISSVKRALARAGTDVKKPA